MAIKLLDHSIRPNLLSHFDPRAKLLILFFFTPLVFTHPLLFLCVDAILIFLVIHLTNKNPLIFLKESQGFIIILFLFFILGLFGGLESDQVPPTPVNTGNTQITDSAIFVFRLFLVYSAGIVFIRSTSATQIRNAVTWLLILFPPTLSKKVGTAISLVFTMFPLLMNEFNRIQEAQKSRGIEINKNPIKKFSAPLFPLMVSSLVRSDELADAMETRCWGSEAKQQTLKDRFSHHALYKSLTLRDSFFFVLLSFYLFIPTFLKFLI